MSFFVAVAGSGFFLLRDTPKNTYTPEVGVYLALVLMLIVVLVGISARKGPKPKWRWGKKDKDDPEQDF